MFGTTTKRIAIMAVATGLGLSLAACGSSDDNSGEGEGKGTVTLGIIPSWTDGLSTALLWENVLEDKGYTVEIKELSDAGPLYEGLAGGDIDVYPSAWPEVTHKAYMEKNADDLEDLGAYYDNAKLTLAVPERSELKSIEDLIGKAGDYDGTIVGIEQGAGLTAAVQDNVIPDYKLAEDGWKLQTSSTNAMITALGDAVEAKEDMVVTLWRPFWANSEFGMRDLEDPKGSLGEPETLNEVANADFSGEFPEVAEMMGNAKLDDEQYGALEKGVVDAGDDEDAQREAVATWISDNQDWVDGLGG
jgi:glycine betaine/proline transport system substrate-binding protein